MDLDRSSATPASTSPSSPPRGATHAWRLPRRHAADHQLLAHVIVGIVVTSSLFFAILAMTRH